VLREALLRMSRSSQIRRLVTAAPVTRGVVDRFVAGESAADVTEVTARLVATGRLVTIDHLGEDTVDRQQADRVTNAYLGLLGRLDNSRLTPAAEVSVKLTALGLQLSGGREIALENARRICSAAQAVDTTVTVDAEDHTTTDATLDVLAELRRDFPSTGAVVQAYLRRTEADCRDLAVAGSRVRLCKGAYAEPESVAYVEKQQVDLSYVRCMKILMAGEGYPMFATHDPRLLAIALKLAHDRHRDPDSYELQMLYGVRPGEQQRLAASGHRMRVYVPYGEDWYGYLVRRLAERPANLAFFARSLVPETGQVRQSTRRLSSRT
jgi:proline dehydrogenase